MSNPDTINITDLAEYGRVSIQSVRRWVRRGLLPAPVATPHRTRESLLPRQAAIQAIDRIAEARRVLAGATT